MPKTWEDRMDENWVNWLVASVERRGHPVAVAHGGGIFFQLTTWQKHVLFTPHSYVAIGWHRATGALWGTGPSPVCVPRIQKLPGWPNQMNFLVGQISNILTNGSPEK